MAPLTIKDVAKAAGVSTATVSRVINHSGYVSNEVRLHVQKMIERLNYQPNVLARSLKMEKTKTIGMVLPDMTNAYLMTAARIVQKRLMEEGYHLIYMDSGEDPVKEREAIQLLLGMRIEALVLAGTGENGDLVNQIMQAGTTTILMDRTIQGVNSSMVLEDNVSASEEAASRIIVEFGAQFGIICGPTGISTARERYEGVVRALETAGLAHEFEQRMIYEGDFTRGSGSLACSYFMNMTIPPRAVISFNNEMTYGFYLRLKELGAGLDSIKVVSFGELDAAPLFSNRLAVIRPNPQLIGEAVAELVLKRVKDGNHEKEKRILMPRFESF
ncbi:LacI family DNA-binding transcriptional regulator [Paenibacillus piri]|uniref:LacI family DNA-binding transcriptional regulator n=1 Tax=Paenibacillus piri TaxID=2547395 RepID=UPI0014052319|nr:LacI family DNA-binding transcriptional regulator [Paenibacillus piri]